MTPSGAALEEEARLGCSMCRSTPCYETADVVSLHVPLNDQTRDMVDAEALGRMKPKAILINTCRGKWSTNRRSSKPCRRAHSGGWPRYAGRGASRIRPIRS